jgi:Rrf2 family protein
MSGLVKFTEAASLALHTMSYLSADAERLVPVHEVAERLEVSENHLAKVMQRLVRAGLAHSTRGPKGGFILARDPGAISLLEVYEAIEGPLDTCPCLFPTPRCSGSCLLGDVIGKANRQVRDHLSRTHLSDLTRVFARKPKHGKKRRTEDRPH